MKNVIMNKFSHTSKTLGGKGFIIRARSRALSARFFNKNAKEVGAGLRGVKLDVVDWNTGNWILKLN